MELFSSFSLFPKEKKTISEKILITSCVTTTTIHA
jgi:hypothetical protein